MHYFNGLKILLESIETGGHRRLDPVEKNELEEIDR
jgi:hypothetical protein